MTVLLQDLLPMQEGWGGWRHCHSRVPDALQRP